MSSSNRHWPSMFKSKPSSNNHDHHLISSVCHRTPYSSGCDERTPEPKPRWNPRPEQIRILEAIFNSGMVNPPRDEIRKIRAQLQEYGQVGDANVFYWFQNRKSRSKHKQRQLAAAAVPKSLPPPASTSFVGVPSSPSSSSPDKETGPPTPTPTTNLVDLLNSPTSTTTTSSAPFLAEPFFFPMQQHQHEEGFCFSDGGGGSFLLSELMLMKKDININIIEDECPKKSLSCCGTTNTSSSSEAIAAPSLSLPPPCDLILPLPVDGVGPATKSTVVVFINEVWFEIGSGPFNVREAFGDDAVLIQSTGQPVLTDEWGVTLQPLQHGGFYYLLRPFAPLPLDRTIDLI